MGEVIAIVAEVPIEGEGVGAGTALCTVVILVIHIESMLQILRPAKNIQHLPKRIHPLLSGKKQCRLLTLVYMIQQIERMGKKGNGQHELTHPPGQGQGHNQDQTRFQDRHRRLTYKQTKETESYEMRSRPYFFIMSVSPI